MKIVKLQAENVKRLRAVEIIPDGNTVVIAGRNGQGKTSVLDSIWLALGGGPATKGTARPIRDGESRAQVTVDLGELKVTRTWTGDDKTTLKVENTDGARYNSPQAMLDSLIGRLSFDPLSFAQADGRAQLAALLDLIDLPFNLDELATERQELYAERTVVGREGRQVEGQLQGLPEPPPGLPEEELSTADVIAAARRATELRTEAEHVASEHAHAAHLVAQTADNLRRAQEAHDQAVEQERAQAKRKRQAVDALADQPDQRTIDAELARVEQTNEQIRARRQRAEVQQRLHVLRDRHNQLAEQIRAIDDRKAQAVASAAMPIAGLSFDDTGVLYRGVPFKQASGAEQLRVSVAMAMAMNPKVRIIRITDGSLLDSENMALLREMAVADDFQVWIERVDETGKVGVLIEDGMVSEPAVAQ